MIESTGIHQSIIDADDIEEIHDEQITVGNVFGSLLRHPLQIITRWNWKSALLGAILRASFYFTVYKASKENLWVTMSAVLVEFGFRFFTSGVSGALIQSFRKATPKWLATMIISISLPIFSHTIEFLTHYYQETYFANVFPKSENHARQVAFAVSVFISLLSALFNIFMFRNGVMLVGAGKETRTFGNDLKMIPFLIAEFVTVLPKKMINYVREGKYINAFLILLSFGLTVGTVLGLARGKWSWAKQTAIWSWGILFVWTLVVALIIKLMNMRKAKKD
ncbi:MAG: hypothetical protein ACK5NT_12070 [Pyrinomonadaceae bacterium]